MIDRGELDGEALGSAIRDRRLHRGLTLTTLAERSDLSQPFLSQVENGRARPSMMSLYRIAAALGCTPQAFFSGPAGDSSAPRLLRAADMPVVGVPSDGSGVTSHLILTGSVPFHMVEYRGLPDEFLAYLEHDGFEAVYVLAGTIEVDVAGEVTRMARGDRLSFSARLPHRMRRAGRTSPRVLLIETEYDSGQTEKSQAHTRKERATRRPRTTDTSASAVSPRRDR